MNKFNLWAERLNLRRPPLSPNTTQVGASKPEEPLPEGGGVGARASPTQVESIIFFKSVEELERFIEARIKRIIEIYECDEPSITKCDVIWKLNYQLRMLEKLKKMIALDPLYAPEGFIYKEPYVYAVMKLADYIDTVGEELLDDEWEDEL
jgi:hypothetical protein